MDAGSMAISEVPKLKKSFFFKWSSFYLAQSPAWVLLGYITLYATDVMGLDIATVSIAFVLSKMFDGFTDVVVGIWIDKARITRFGRVRPFQIAIVFFWLFIGFAFSAPPMSQYAGVIYLFVMYTMIYSVCHTLTTCAENAYLYNCLDDARQAVPVNIYGALVTAFGSLAASIILPNVISGAGTDPAKWRTMVWCMAIPMMCIGMIRILTCREKQERMLATAATNKDRSSVKDMLHALAENKYIMILSGMIFLFNFATSINNASIAYYCKYILGDVKVQTTLSLAMLPMMIAMAIAPSMIKKFGMKKVLTVSIVSGIIGSLVRLVNIRSIPLAFVCSVFSDLGFPMFNMYINPMVIDCMDYGEYNTGVRIEGTLGAVQSVANKISSAVGTGISGLLMGLAGYVGTLEVQSDSALSMIIVLTTWIPATLYVLFWIVYRFYDLEKKLPAMRLELDERRKALMKNNDTATEVTR